MVSFGFLASLGMYSPSACLGQSVATEAAGSDRVWTVDHFHPQVDRFEDGPSAYGNTDGPCCQWRPRWWTTTDARTPPVHGDVGSIGLSRGIPPRRFDGHRR